MNEVLLSGSFKMISKEDGKRVCFKLGIRKDFKDKEGNYGYNNPLLIVPTYNEGLANFIKTYVKDGDKVEVKAEVTTWEGESEDGKKTYHQDLICNKLSIISSKEVSKEEKVSEESPMVMDGFTEIDVSEDDLPF